MGIPKALYRHTYIGVASLVSVGATGVVFVGCSAREQREESTIAVASQAVEGNAVNFSVAFPVGLTGLDLVLSADASLKIDDRVKTVTLSGAPAQIANTGTGQTEIGADAAVGSLTSQGNVFLRNRAKVLGNVRTGGVVSYQQGASITGRTEEHATLTPNAKVTWSVDFGNATGGDVSLEPDQKKAIGPGSYGVISTKAGSTLRLSTGTYTFKSLAFESGSTIELDDSAGWVGIYVRSSMSHRGTVTTIRGGQPALFIGYAGTGAVAIESPLKATFIAPFASVNLASISTGHAGAVFAKAIEVQPGTTLTQMPYPYWTTQPKTPAGDTGSSGRRTLDDVLAGQAAGPEVRAFLTAGYTSLSLAASEAAAAALRAKRTEVLAAVSSAFDPNGSFIDKRCMVSAAAALKHVDAVPFLSRALWAVSPTLDETKVDPHEARFAGESVVLGYALSGLRTIALAGHCQGKDALYQAALTHPLTGVRARAVYFLNHLFGEDAAARALLKSRLAAKDVWMTTVVAGTPLGTATINTSSTGPTSTPKLAITPLLDCVESINSTTWKAWFGYNNPALNPVTLEVGNNNTFNASPADRAQTTTFQPGEHHQAFSVQFNGTPITWSVQGKPVSASSQSTICGGVVIQ